MKKTMTCMVMAALMMMAVPNFAAAQESDSSTDFRGDRNGQYAEYCCGRGCGYGNGNRGGYCWNNQE